ncbi:hypothetical protein M951_chr3193 (nucleomorph) [Lotharella oceanica]|uniref:Uncharacterized protein n=1 Tax=Lotharella oceanica TaxID=641309 RepID=A0A060DGH4_9EUKA|nr:hypothetical protein M951_chr112 [Lotharella oceanica]AIB09698.1 hypothetical protein M951_chr1219 [Lotharella oceanica]AIB09715.1 hypothetical protein M951_chr212 [Lotharella oceanica]AIB09901.1 hypothetical protein M951_chr2209 [Lotharella oceanica]AIB09918.1 hypothetical protein M951_chr312 [Lotharella oceanica]
MKLQATILLYDIDLTHTIPIPHTHTPHPHYWSNLKFVSVTRIISANEHPMMTRRKSKLQREMIYNAIKEDKCDDVRMCIEQMANINEFKHVGSGWITPSPISAIQNERFEIAR